MSTLLKIEFTLDDELADEAGLFISSKVPNGWEETHASTGRLFTLYLEDHPYGMEIVQEFKIKFPKIEISHSEQESEDWTMAWKDFFTPVHCGDTFKIIPPWLNEKQDADIKNIVIEPKMAFGTGHHPTTALCLETIGKLTQKQTIKTDQNFLDLGTGSGILGIGLCKLGLKGTGLDIDPQAVACAVENVQKNAVEKNIELAVGSIECLDPKIVFDVVVANILSGPLIEMAYNIVSHTKLGGTLILSGILAGEQADAVEDAYKRKGIGSPKRFIDGEWECLVWENITK